MTKKFLQDRIAELLHEKELLEIEVQYWKNQAKLVEHELKEKYPSHFPQEYPPEKWDYFGDRFKR